MNAFFRYNVFEPKEGTNPLVYAALLNRDGHARTLLFRGGKLNQKGWETLGYRRSLPIEVAFRSRHFGMVTLFVEEGGTVPPHIFTRSFFKRERFEDLPSCSPEIPTSIAKLLAQTDEFVESINDCFNEAAWRATKMSNQLPLFRGVTEQDLIASIRRFIQIAEEQFTPDLMRDAFFRFAVSQGYRVAAQYTLSLLGTLVPCDILVKLYKFSGKWKTIPMIRFLLDNGANALARTSSGDSALHTILWEPVGMLFPPADDADEDDILDVVKLLVDCGCDPFEADSQGNTPLHIAVERGYVSVTRYLLSLAAPLSPDLLVTLSRWQSCWSTAPMVRLLVENGTNRTR